MPSPSRVADLTIVTISTVGYGDIAPSTPALRAFTIFYILIGCGFVFVQLANVFAGVLEAFTNVVKRLTKMLCTTNETLAEAEGHKKVSYVAGRGDGLSGKARDLTGGGTTDFIEPPMAVVFWAQELLPALLLLMRVPEFHTRPRASLGFPGPYTHAACGRRRGAAGKASIAEAEAIRPRRVESALRPLVPVSL